jgi:serine/threonine-protein kinase
MNEPREGDVLAGKFRIERVLGVGGMGMVVSAMHLQLDERVAIKFLLPEALMNAEAVARFGREARAAVKQAAAAEAEPPDYPSAADEPDI